MPGDLVQASLAFPVDRHGTCTEDADLPRRILLLDNELRRRITWKISDHASSRVPRSSIIPVWFCPFFRVPSASVIPVVDGVFSIPLEADGSAIRPSRCSRRNSPINLRQYIGGKENVMVQAAVDFSRHRSKAYNPLVFFGPAETGKTLLAHGLAARWKQQNPDGRILAVTGGEFAKQYRNAVQTDLLKDLRAKYHSLELLVIDDLDDTAGRTGTQTELIHTFDALFELNRPVIATLKRSPFDEDRLVPGLVSRLSAGLSVPLCPPELKARRVILQRLGQLHSIALSESVVDLIAEALPKVAAQPPTIPQLNTTVLQLDKLARKESQPIDEHLARHCLASRLACPRLDLKSVIKKVSRYFNLKVADLKGPTRRQHVVRARGVAILLARRLTDKSLEQVGRHFGNRDHTTVLHACRKTESLIQSDPMIRRAVDELTLQLSTVLPTN